MLLTLTVIAVILMQLYIAVCTYWIFSRFDKYEKIAAWVIERYLSARIAPAAAHRDSDIARMVVTEPTEPTVPTVSSVSTESELISASKSVAIIIPRSDTQEQVTNCIRWYASRVGIPQASCDNELNKWYSQLIIDLVAICIQIRQVNRSSEY